MSKVAARKARAIFNAELDADIAKMLENAQDMQAGEVDLDDLTERGGPGSGHFGHEGRPGQVGGSQPGSRLNVAEKLARQTGRKFAGLGHPARMAAALKRVEDRLQGLHEVITPDGLVVAESAFVLDPVDGHILLAKTGVESGVEFTDDELARMFDAVLTHNHPSSNPLSIEDVMLAAHRGLREIRAVGDDFIYTATFSEDFRDSSPNYRLLWGQRLALEYFTTYAQLQDQIYQDKADRVRAVNPSQRDFKEIGQAHSVHAWVLVMEGSIGNVMEMSAYDRHTGEPVDMGAVLLKERLEADAWLEELGA